MGTPADNQYFEQAYRYHMQYIDYAQIAESCAVKFERTIWKMILQKPSEKQLDDLFNISVENTQIEHVREWHRIQRELKITPFMVKTFNKIKRDRGACLNCIALKTVIAAKDWFRANNRETGLNAPTYLYALEFVLNAQEKMGWKMFGSGVHRPEIPAPPIAAQNGPISMDCGGC